MDKYKLAQEQKALAKKLITTDEIEETQLVAGVSSVYMHDNIISVIIIYDTKENKVIERKYIIEKTTLPFHKDFLCYRECPSLLKAFNLLKNKPSFVFVEGDGILHPNKMGVACYFGLFADIPTIGVNSRKSFCVQEGDAVYHEKEILAKVLMTKEKANPIFVSQGHRISLSTAVEKTKELLFGHKLPEPVYLAHKYAAKLKGELKVEHAPIKSKHPTKVRIIEVHLPEYNLKVKPDYLKVGQKVDLEIEKNLLNGQYIYRAVGKDDHPNLTLNEFVEIIIKLGTDKYDKNRKEVCSEGFSMYDHDIQAGSFEIKNNKIALDSSYEYPSMFGDTVKKFYENVLLDRGYSVRIDILIIYDATKLIRAKKIDSNAEGARPELEECLYKFKEPEKKQEALVAVVKILR